jgi:hypothetical protein
MLRTVSLSSFSSLSANAYPTGVFLSSDGASSSPLVTLAFFEDFLFKIS